MPAHRARRLDALQEQLDRESVAAELPPLEAYEEEPRGRRRDRPPSAVLPEPIWFHSAEPNLARRDIVHELLGAGGLGSIYGGPGSGKTFLALDLAIAVARGADWSGRRTLQGVVLYAAGEGHQSVLGRIAAYRRHYYGEERPALPFGTIPAAINLLDPRAHVEAVVTLANEAQANYRLPTSLIVIDTLARAMAGADENSGEDMGAAIRSADLLRDRIGAHVLLVHHTGKAENGARGHSSLKAALDTEIEVSGTEGVRTARVTKQRDLPVGATFSFSLKPVVIGRNPIDGQDVTSCIVEHVDAPVTRRREPTTKNQAALLAGLREHVRASERDVVAAPDLITIAKAQGITGRNRLAEARKALEKYGFIAECVGGIRLLEDKL